MEGLSVVIPCHNEALRLSGTLRGLLAWLAPRVPRLQILVVDDGSTDGTAEVALREGGGRVEVLRHERRRGKGAAVRTGVLQARQPWTLVMDADMAVPIQELERFAEETGAAPIVIGSKHLPGSRVQGGALRRLCGAAGQVLVRALVVGGFRDTQCGFKLFRTDVASALFSIQRLDGFGYDFEVLYLARRMGFGVVELPVRVADPGGGSVRPGSYLRVLGELCAFLRHRWVVGYPCPDRGLTSPGTPPDGGPPRPPGGG